MLSSCKLDPFSALCTSDLRQVYKTSGKGFPAQRGRYISSSGSHRTDSIHHIRSASRSCGQELRLGGLCSFRERGRPLRNCVTRSYLPCRVALWAESRAANDRGRASHVTFRSYVAWTPFRRRRGT